MVAKAEQLRKDEMRGSFIKKPPGSFAVNELNVNPRQGRGYTDATLSFIKKKDDERKIQQRDVAESISTPTDEVEASPITSAAGKSVLANMSTASRTVPQKVTVSAGDAMAPSHEPSATRTDFPEGEYRSNTGNRVFRMGEPDKPGYGRIEILDNGGQSPTERAFRGIGGQSGTREQQQQQFLARQARPVQQQAFDPNAAARQVMGDFVPVTEGFSPGVAGMASRNQQLQYNARLQDLAGQLAGKAMGETGDTARTGQRLASAERIAGEDSADYQGRTDVMAEEAVARNEATAAGATAKRRNASKKELKDFYSKRDARWREFSKDEKNKGVTKTEFDIMDKENTSPEVLEYYGLGSSNEEKIGQEMDLL